MVLENTTFHFRAVHLNPNLYLLVKARRSYYTVWKGIFFTSLEFTVLVTFNNKVDSNTSKRKRAELSAFLLLPSLLLKCPPIGGSRSINCNNLHDK